MQVVVFPPVGCGVCFHCLRGQPQLCADMRFVGGQLPGGLAEHVIIREDNLIVVPDAVPDFQRVLIEPLGVGVHAVARAQVEPGESAVVLGAGAIGLFTALVAQRRGLERVLVGEPSAARRARAAALGLETFDPGTTSIAAAVADRIRSEGADVIFDASARRRRSGRRCSRRERAAGPWSSGTHRPRSARRPRPRSVAIARWSAS